VRALSDETEKSRGNKNTGGEEENLGFVGVKSKTRKKEGENDWGGTRGPSGKHRKIKKKRGIIVLGFTGEKIQNSCSELLH